MDECIICMDKINNNEYIMFLNDIEANCSCMKNSKIHKKCFKEWVSSKNNELLCPICLNNLSPVNVLLYEKDTFTNIQDYLNENNADDNNAVDNNIIIEYNNTIESEREINEPTMRLIQHNINNRYNKSLLSICSCICPLLFIFILCTFILSNNTTT